MCDYEMWRKVRETVRYQEKRRERCRKGLMPLRKRRKRLHKKLAKRGFGASTRAEVYSSPIPGYGTKGTDYDLFKRIRREARRRRWRKRR